MNVSVKKDRSFIQDRFSTRLRWEQLDQVYLKKLIEFAKLEDLQGLGLAEKPEGIGDLTTHLLDLKEINKAQLVAREKLVVCGLPLISLILEIYGGMTRFVPSVLDGSIVEAQTVLGYFEGDKSLLESERVILNFVQKLSGIATNVHSYVAVLNDSSTRLLDTRKTTPAFRGIEKYAVACAGGWNHRFGLFDRLMIKDNHFVALKKSQLSDLKAIIQEMRRLYPYHPVEIEVDNLDDLEMALEVGPDIILIDNFSVEHWPKAVEIVEEKVCLEASGGINLETLKKAGHLGLDFISCGKLTHGASWVDIGLDWI